MHTPIDITDTTLAWACTLPLTNSVARTLFYTVKKEHLFVGIKCMRMCLWTFLFVVMEFRVI